MRSYINDNFRERKNKHGCVGVVLAVNGETLEGRDVSDVCALNRSQTRCFTMFYSVLFHFYTLTFAKNCLTVPFLVEIA